MEPERYLPRSQVPATCSHRESGESNPTDFLRPILILSYLRLGLTSGLFPSSFLT
jgi:hypothetical protein